MDPHALPPEAILLAFAAPGDAGERAGAIITKHIKDYIKENSATVKHDYKTGDILGNVPQCLLAEGGNGFLQLRGHGVPQSRKDLVLHDCRVLLWDPKVGWRGH